MIEIPAYVFVIMAGLSVGAFLFVLVVRWELKEIETKARQSRDDNYADLSKKIEKAIKNPDLGDLIIAPNPVFCDWTSPSQISASRGLFVRAAVEQIMEHLGLEIKHNDKRHETEYVVAKIAPPEKKNKK